MSEQINNTLQDWNIKASKCSMNTSNPIRLIVDKLDISQINKEKKLIALSIGILQKKYILEYLFYR